MPKKLKKVKSVFIKPNLVSDVKEYIQQGSNTDIRIIEAVIKYLSQYPHLKIYLGESEVGTTIKGRKVDLALKVMDIPKLQEKYNFAIINLTQDDQVLIKIPRAKFLKQVKMSQTLMSADLIINLPKIKTHKYATITCALKNMFGVIPDPLKIIYHQNIHQVLADLNKLFYKKMFVVTDGIIGMEGSGPLYGTRRKLDLLVFADNPLFNDAVVAKEIIKVPLSRVKHIQLTNQWAKHNLNQIKLKGDYQLTHKIKPFQPVTSNLFIKIEGKLMQYPWLVKILFSDWFRKNISHRLAPILTKLRGGSYSWYEK